MRSAGEDRVTTVSTVDIEAIGRDVPYELVPWFLQLQTPVIGCRRSFPCPNRPRSSPKARTSDTRSSGSRSQRSPAIGYVILVRREMKGERAAVMS